MSRGIPVTLVLTRRQAAALLRAHLPAYYARDRRDGHGEGDVSDWSDFHIQCDTYFEACHITGRTYCACGFWYDRHFWDL